MKSLDIAICTHERPDELSQVIESLAAMEKPEGVELRLLLVLNACSPHTVTVAHSAVASLPFEACVVEEPAPGLSHARNRAIEECRAEWMAFLDDDVRVAQGWANALAASARNAPADIIAGRTLLWWRDCPRPVWWSPHFNWIVSGFDHGVEDFTLSPARAVGANFVCRRAVYEAVGRFDVTLGRKGKLLTAGEESDYLDRADEQGFVCIYSADATVEHLVPPNRLTAEYFRQVAHNTGRAHYKASRKQALARIRSIAYQSWVAARSFVVQLVCHANSTTGRYNLIRKANATGSLRELISPSKND